MLKFFRRRAPKRSAAVVTRPEVAEALTMSAWGLNEEQWKMLSEFERRECRRNLTTAPRFEAVA